MINNTVLHTIEINITNLHIYTNLYDFQNVKRDRLEEKCTTITLTTTTINLKHYYKGNRRIY